MCLPEKTLEGRRGLKLKSQLMTLTDVGPTVALKVVAKKQQHLTKYSCTHILYPSCHRFNPMPIKCMLLIASYCGFLQVNVDRDRVAGEDCESH